MSDLAGVVSINNMTPSTRKMLVVIYLYVAFKFNPELARGGHYGLLQCCEFAAGLERTSFVHAVSIRKAYKRVNQQADSTPFYGHSYLHKITSCDNINYTIRRILSLKTPLNTINIFFHLSFSVSDQ